MTSILTNNSAMTALQVLNASNRDLSRTEQRISTGLKVSSAKDDGATYAIAQNMRAQMSSWQAVNESLKRSEGLVDVTQSAVSEISDLLSQMKSKALSLKDTSLDTTSKTAIQTDITALRDQINTTAKNASFNGVNLLDGDAPSIIGMEIQTNLSQPYYAVATAWNVYNGNIVQGQISDTGSVNLNFTITDGGSGYDAEIENNNSSYQYPESHVSFSGNVSGSHDLTLKKQNSDGTPSDDYFWALINSNVGEAQLNNASFTPDHATSATSYVSNVNGVEGSVDEFSMLSASLNLDNLDYTNPDSIFSKIDTAFDFVNQKAAYYGTQSNSIDNQLKQNTKLIDSLDMGIGNLVDADMAKESAGLQAQQVRQQLATQTLSIANQQPKWVLDLFK